MINRTSLCLMLLGAVGLACLAPVSFSGEKDPLAVRIKAEDLCSGKYEIVGRLGKPYGEISKVRGAWEDNKQFIGKGIEHFLRITHIDGNALQPDQQIVIGDHVVLRVKGLEFGEGDPPFHGKVVEVRAYESGGYVRYPAKVREILDIPRSGDNVGFQFYSFLYLIV